MMTKYAGIGSRETPLHICELMETVAINLANLGWTLRSGHAKGADKAFEKGCDSVNGLKEIFTSKSQIPEEAFNIAKLYHPAWYNCDERARRLHARNSMIILGENLDDPVYMVLCYAPGGEKWGGTSQGIRIAKAYNRPVWNMFDEKTYNSLKERYG